MANIDIPNFFRDFVGSMEDFRTLLENLEWGRADESKYGPREEQPKILEQLHNSFVGGHPTDSTDSVNSEDFGEWLYYNGVFHPTNGQGGGGQGLQGP